MPVTVCTVVVCKRHLGPALPHEDMAYLYTLRLLLERLSWLARSRRAVLAYTLSHVVRFNLAQLRHYEGKLRADPDCTISWDHIDPRGGKIDQPKRVEQLQLADICASGIAAAFEPNDLGVKEDRYLRELAIALWRSRQGSAISYGIKMHPWSPRVQHLYPWVSAL